MPRKAVWITMPASHVMSLDIFAIDRTMIASRRRLIQGLAHGTLPRIGFLGHALNGPTYVPPYLRSLQYHGNNSVLFLVFTHRPSTIDHANTTRYHKYARVGVKVA